MLTYEQLLTLKADRGFCEEQHVHEDYYGNCQFMDGTAIGLLLKTCEALFKEKRERGS